MSNLVPPYELQFARFFCPWDSLGKDTAVGCHILLQGIFPTQGLNPHPSAWEGEFFFFFFYHQHHLGNPIVDLLGRNS